MAESGTDVSLSSFRGLPAPLAGFVGREAEVAEVSGLVREYRMVTVTGPAVSARPGWLIRSPGP